jgi:hypothetical protein
MQEMRQEDIILKTHGYKGQAERVRLLLLPL